MKNILFSITTIFVISIAYIILTAQKSPDNRKYYYAFSEKIYLTEVPNKFLVKANSAPDAEALASVFSSLNTNPGKRIVKQRDNCLLIETDNIKAFRSAVQNVGPKVLFIKPCYRYQQAEMYYFDEIIVETLPGNKITDVIDKLNLSTKVAIISKNFYSIIKTPVNIDALELANRIQETGLVSYSQPDFFTNTEPHQVIPNDTYFNNQYYLRNTGQIFNPVENHAGTPNADINATFAWNATMGSNGIIVAVIDQGVTGNHPDLPNARQVRLNGSNFAPGQNANDPTPDGNNNHGNACAGIIAATQGNSEGISGIAPNVRIMPVKVAFGIGGTSLGGLAAAIDFAWQNGANVISNSWGSASDNPNFSPAIVAAINRAVTQGRGGRGSVVAFSASNSATHNWGLNGQVRFPSNVQINGVLTVGASDRFDRQADYSPMSDVASANNQIIDIVAPSHRAYPPESYLPGVGGIPGEGFEVWSSDIPGNAGYNQWNDASFPVVAPAFGEVMPNFGTNNLSYTGRFGGTSAACPQVSAVAALILSVNNTLTQQQVFDIITQSAEKVGGYTYNVNGWSSELGNGRLNACAALSRIPNHYQVSGNDLLCTNATYTIPGLAPGSTIAWGSSNNSIATISPSGVASKVGNGTVTFTATINIPNRCGISTSTKTVSVGPPAPVGSLTIDGIDPRNFSLCRNQESGILAYPGIIEPNVWYEWDLPIDWVSLETGTNTATTQDYMLSVYPGTDGWIYVRRFNACGYSNFFSVNVTFDPWCGNYYTISPNPATDNITIDGQKQKKNIKDVQIIDKTGQIKRIAKFGKNVQRVNLNISNLAPDIYYIKIFDGNGWTATKFIKQ